MPEPYIWGGGTNTPDSITNAKLNQTTEHFTERIDSESALAKQFSYNEAGSNSSTLQFAIYGGNLATEAEPIVVADEALTLAPNADNYVEVNRATGEVSSNTTEWTAGYYHLYQVTTDGSSFLSITDFRGVGGGSGSTADASASVKGVVKLSTAPASPTEPIAVGDNDSRMTNARTPTGGAGGVLSGTFPNPGFAVDMVEQTEFEAHTDATAPHAGHFDIDGGKAMTGNMDFGGFEGTNALPGTTPNSLATVSQVDAAASGYKDLMNVKAMSSANAALSGLSSIDAVTIAGGDRVLLVGQTTTSENGPWVAAAGAWARPDDFDTGDTPDAGTRVFVVNGAARKGTSWTLLTAGAVIDTDPLQWTQTGAAGTGEANTASNAGTGTGTLAKPKAGLDLPFKTLAAGSSKLGITNNTNEVVLDVVPANIDKNTLGGSAATVASGGTGKTGIAKGALLYASATDTLGEVAPNGTGTAKYLQQTSDGTPVWAIPSVPGFAGTSSTSVAVSGGSKVFTTQSGLGYTPGQRLRASVSGSPSTYVEGYVSSYSESTLVVYADAFDGSGTHSNWNINIASEPVTLTYATQAEAEAGTENTHVMTSLRTAQAIDAEGVVHLSGAETLTGKKTLVTELIMTEIATPSTPSSTHHAIYPKSDGKLYHLNSAGAEVEIGAGGGGVGPSVGGDLYLFNNSI